MSSEQLADGVNPLDAELAATWDILKGYSGRDTDLGIARRFGGAAAAYSLRDIGAMNGRVVRVRRDVDGDGTDKEEDFSANQVSSGALEDWVNGKLESTLPADVDTAAAAYSLRKVKASYSGDAIRIRRSSDDIEVDVAFDSEGKVSASSAITNVAEEGGESGQTTDTTLGDFISGTDAFVHTWYDQAGANDAVQGTAANQPKIAENGALLDGIKFDAATDGTSPNFLQVATKLGVTTDHFVSAVFNGYQTDSSAFGAFLNTRNGNAGFQYGIAATDKVQAFFYAGAGNNANSSSSFTLSNNSAKRLVTFDKDGNNLTGFGNATTNGISLSNGINTPSTTVTNIGVGGNVGTTTSLGLRANINELIVYETDQADNRFKIESNINNYYGLYTFQGDGFVETWYDQSGNGNDATQGTAGSQPAIVQNGGQVKVGNEASIKFDGTDDYLERATYTQGELAQINTIFSVAKLDTYSDENRKVYDGHLNSARNMLQLNPVGNGQFAHYAGSVAATGEDADTNQHLFTSRLNGVASRLYIDGVQKTTSDTGSFGMQGITIGANHDQTTNNCWKGDIQEIIVYNSDQNDDRANQQDDINNYYTIY